MRRLLALVTLIALIGTGCSSDDSGSDDTTTTTVETTATIPETTTTELAQVGGPVVYLAEGGASVAASDDVDLAAPFGSTIELAVVPIGPIEPDLTQPVGTDILTPRWTVLSSGQGECAFATGQIIISKTAAESFSGDSDFELDSETLFGELAGESLVLAKVPPGEEFDYIWSAILDFGGIASLHYPVSPLPKWKYGPAAPIEPVGSLTEVPTVTPTGPSVIVLDRFGEQGRDVPSELEASDAATRGHGEFIAGILQRMGVDAEERNVVLTDDTVGSEKSVAEALANTGDNVTNISMGIAPCVVKSPVRIDVALPPIGIGAAMATRAMSASQPIVAAAGNHGEPNACVAPWFPAFFALGEQAWESYIVLLEEAASIDAGTLLADIELLAGSTISVGSTAGPDAISSRASFSACGATAWAPGTNVISDYDNELGVWSGTSFAAPQIAAAVALGLM